MERWPNFFIVGPPKTGTTSLYSYLNSVPGIFMSPVKEPHYFSNVAKAKMDKSSKIPDKNKYLKLFANVKNEKIIGDASASYFSHPLVPELIHQISPSAHIIISLRNPINRIYSAYLMGNYMGIYKFSFHEELELAFQHGPNHDKKNMLRLKPNVHSKSVKNYIGFFGKERVKIIIFEEWIKDIKNTVNEIIRFLGLDYSIKEDFQNIYNPYVETRGIISKGIMWNSNIRKICNSLFSTSTNMFLSKLLTKKSTKPKMNKEDEDKLLNFFRDDVNDLEKILGRKFPWLNFYQ